MDHHSSGDRAETAPSDGIPLADAFRVFTPPEVLVAIEAATETARVAPLVFARKYPKYLQEIEAEKRRTEDWARLHGWNEWRVQPHKGEAEFKNLAVLKAKPSLILRDWWLNAFKTGERRAWGSRSEFGSDRERIKAGYFFDAERIELLEKESIIRLIGRRRKGERNIAMFYQVEVERPSVARPMEVAEQIAAYKASIMANGNSVDLTAYIDAIAEMAGVTLPAVHYSDDVVRGVRWAALTKRLAHDITAGDVHLSPITILDDYPQPLSPSHIAAANGFNAFRQVGWPVLEDLISGKLVAEGRRAGEEDGPLKPIPNVFWKRREWMICRDDSGTVKALPLGENRETASDGDWLPIWWDIHVGPVASAKLIPAQEPAVVPPVAGKSKSKRSAWKTTTDADIVEALDALAADPNVNGAGWLPNTAYISKAVNDWFTSQDQDNDKTRHVSDRELIEKVIADNPNRFKRRQRGKQSD